MTDDAHDARAAPTASCRRSATPSREFADLEHGAALVRGSGRSRAGRRSSARPGDFLEYAIGDESILVVRDRDRRRSRRSTTRACTAARRLADGLRRFADGDDPVPRTTRGATTLDGRLADVRRPRGVRRRCPTTCALARGARRALGRLRVRQPRSRRRAAARLPRPAARRCSRRTTSTRCGSAAYLHARSSPRTGRSSSTRSTRLPRAGHAPADPAVDRRRRASRTSSSARTRTTAGCPARAASCGRARASASRADEYDEGEILAGLVGGLGGAFLGEERDARRRAARAGPPAGPTLLGAYQAAAHGAARRARPRRLRVRRPT